MRKRRTDSPLADLTSTQGDELYAIIETSTYAEAVRWLSATLKINSSTSGLSRWYKHERNARLRQRLVESIDVSKVYDCKVDAEVLDRGMGNALKTLFFDAVATGNTKAILDFGSTALDYNKDQREETKLDRTMKAEREAAALREELTAARAENEELRLALANIGKVNQADPAAVMDALDAALGRKVES